MADSSLNYDRAIKRALYARHGIAELWIVNLAAGEVEICRQPTASGYAAVEIAGRDRDLEPSLLPGARVSTAALFR